MARRLTEAVAAWASGLLSVVMPGICEVCGRRLTDGERHVCLPCLTGLPRTGLHLCADNNEIHRRVSDNHVLVDRAASMFHYYRGVDYTSLILSAKYHSRPSILSYLGAVYASEIAPSGFFDDIDRIVPVPLHWSRLMSRGYNQTEYLARGIGRATGLPVAPKLLRLPSRHASQTRRSAAARAANVAGTFRAGRDAARLAGHGCHLLVVDDVITTGATIRDCLRALSEAIPDVRLSVLSLGLAHQL